MGKPTPKQIALAELVGALRPDGRIDWRAMFEAVAPPELKARRTKSGGRPRGDFGDLVVEIMRTMEANRAVKGGKGERAACRQISADKNSRWYGVPSSTLESRFRAWQRRVDQLTPSSLTIEPPVFSRPLLTQIPSKKKFT